MTGRIYGVGLGPGDPELITRKAARLVAEADVIAYHSGTHGRSIARGIAAELIPDGVIEEKLVYPVTVGTTDHPGGYDGAIADFYDECAARLSVHLDADRTVVVLCEGDPLFYGSYMYLHDRLSKHYAAEVIPGVTSFSAAAAASAEPLVRRTDVLTILPGTLPEPELARRLADTDGAVIMKLGRTFESVRNALEQTGRLDDAVYVERATMAGQRIVAAADVDPDTVPYFFGDPRSRRQGSPQSWNSRPVTPGHVRGRRTCRDTRTSGDRTRPRRRQMAHAGGVGGARVGRSRHRVRAVRRSSSRAAGPAATFEWEHRRGRSRPVRTRSGIVRREGRRGVRR